MQTLQPRTIRALRDFLRDDRAATAIEYALIAGMVSIVIASTVFSAGSALRDNYYNEVGSALATK